MFFSDFMKNSLAVVDAESVDEDALWHEAEVAEVMLAGVAAVDERAARDEGAVADDDIALPGAAVVGAEVDEGVALDSAVLDEEGSGADGVDAHVAEP